MSWLYAGVSVINRKLKPCHYAVLGFYHPLLGVLIYAGYIVIDWLFFANPLQVHTWQVYAQIVLACILDVAAFNTRNIAFQCDSSSFLAVVGFIAVLYGFLADEFIFKKPIAGYDLLGAIIILVVTLGVSIYKLISSKN
jgi:drug/metabolite transporter (DMT)-like permease